MQDPPMDLTFLSPFITTLNKNALEIEKLLYICDQIRQTATCTS